MHKLQAQVLAQGVFARMVNRLFVKLDYSRLGTRLPHPEQMLRAHRLLPITVSIEVAALAFMQPQALTHLDIHEIGGFTGGIRDLGAIHEEARERWFDRVFAYFADKAHQGAHITGIHAYGLT